MALFTRLFGRRREEAAARRLYEAIVRQSRRPEFYERFGVPDSLDGRFEMIALHVFLVMRCLKGLGTQEARELSQALFDLFFADMDQSLREMGVGDLGVGKRVKKMAEGFYGRLAAYDAALESGGDHGLREALRRNLLGTLADPKSDALESFVRYVVAQDQRLRREGGTGMLSGEVSFDPPGESPAAALDGH